MDITYDDGHNPRIRFDDGREMDLAELGEELDKAQTLTRTIRSALYGAASDAERDLIQAQQRIRDLEQKLATAQQAREIEAKRAGELAEKVRLYDVDRHTERNRADRAQAREKGLGERVAELEASLARHTERDRADRHASEITRKTQRVAELEQKLATAQQERERERLAAVREHQIEKRRADDNKAWAERAENWVDKLAKDLAQTQGKLIKTRDEREYYCQGLDEARRAIEILAGQIRDIVGTPVSVPATPA